MTATVDLSPTKPADAPAEILPLSGQDREVTGAFAEAVIAGVREKVGDDKLHELLCEYVDRLSGDALKTLVKGRAKDIATTVIDCLPPAMRAEVYARLGRDEEGERAAQKLVAWIESFLPRLRYGVEQALGGGVPPLKSIPGEENTKKEQS